MIEKMKFLSITGPKTDIDRVVNTYLSKYEIHLENALSELTAVESLSPFMEINPYKEFGPAPYNRSKTNRMSPAGISYLYVAGDKNTALSECRLNGKTSVVAELKTKEVLQIIDFSKNVFFQSNPPCAV